MVIKKRAALIGTVALLICVAVYLSVSYNRPEDLSSIEVLSGDSREAASKTLGEAKLVDGSAEGVPGEGILGAARTIEYFSEAKLSRQKALDEAVSILKTSAESTDISAETRDKAAIEIALLADNSLKESKIENLVKSKGFTDCVAFISASGISVVVQPADENGLDAASAAKIKDIVIAETASTADDIRIVEIG